MTIGGWILFGLFSFVVAFAGLCAFINWDSIVSRIITVSTTIIVIIAMFSGCHWYYNNTASGRREMIDQKSNLNGGIERVVNVYTANGDVIARYEGKIDIDTNDGGYVKFDCNGKRYIYYNCFVETIADIG